MNLNRFLFIPALIIAFCSSDAWADEAREDRHDRELNEVKISKKINAANIAVNQVAIAELQAAGVGPQGPAGADGATGVQGAIGLTGPVGATGATGTQGFIGLTGPAGVDGAQGLAGIDCWDTNGNRVNDPAEDINGDSSFNALDCTGTGTGTALTDVLNRLSIIEQSISNQDFDSDGFTPVNGDCNDGDPAIHPNAPEFGVVDNNCNGVIDNASTTADYDSDGLTDWDEVNTYLTDPTNPDTDGDSLPSKRVNRPVLIRIPADCPGPFGGSGCSTAVWRDHWFTYPPVDMSDGIEVHTHLTDPLNPDSDGDGINDGAEIRNGTDPLAP